MRRDTIPARASGSLSNTHAGPRPTPYKRTTRFRYGGYAVPHTEWRTHGRVIRYSLLICSTQKTARQDRTGMEKDILKRASASRPSANWNEDDFDVLADGVVVGRIFKADAAPTRTPWMWTICLITAGRLTATSRRARLQWLH